MKHILRYKILPVFAGLLTAFVVMMVFEFANSFIYPLPEGLDVMDPEAVRAFTASLPWTAYILVFVGWVLGAFKAGYITTYLARENTDRQWRIVGILLTLGGILNNFAIGHAMLFNVIALPMFLVFTYLGHRYLIKTKGPFII